ncbi:hypothetical protein PDJAM_G00004170 [Pangasius djambal]|uniref:Uncharacterized protein n=1 Tax=Pangasius djambal TaxID=1691987 RepID=A0ACC5XYH1_9TELE|nr:hypothetical protein [Pangasius djambal]
MMMMMMMMILWKPLPPPSYLTAAQGEVLKIRYTKDWHFTRKENLTLASLDRGCLDTVDLCLQNAAVIVITLVQFVITLLHLCTVMICNRTIRCHPQEDGFPFESGSSQGFFLVSSQGVFPCHCCLWLAH